jgi:hypothetical protein
MSIDEKELSELAQAGTTICDESHIWVCTACGKTSRTKYGFDKKGDNLCDHGWDASCMCNAVLVEKATCVFKKGRVVEFSQKVAVPPPAERVVIKGEKE